MATLVSPATARSRWRYTNRSLMPPTQRNDQRDIKLPAEPSDKTLPVDPTERTLPALAKERMLPAEPIDRMLPTDPNDSMLRDDTTLSSEWWERRESTESTQSSVSLQSMAVTVASPVMAPPGTTLRPSLKRKAPGTRNERDLWDAGHDVVVGIDEVGRGAWAGPLTLGAVVIPKDKRLTKVRDSKMLTEVERELMFGRIVEWSDAFAVGHATHEECDELGMSAAQKLAARRAIEALGVQPDRVLLDGNWDFVGGGAVPHAAVTKIVKGDATCLSIAAASIVAKVTRDRMMRAAADDHPWWSFDTNKGYPCPRHKTALAGVGPSSIHRRSWVFMEHLPWPGAVRSIPRHLRPDENQGTLFA